MFAMTVVDGSWIFLAFIVIWGISLIYGLYSRRGSGINQRPYHDQYGNAPGAHGQSRISGRTNGEIRNYSRGTR